MLGSWILKILQGQQHPGARLTPEMHRTQHSSCAGAPVVKRIPGAPAWLPVRGAFRGLHLVLASQWPRGSEGKAAAARSAPCCPRAGVAGPRAHSRPPGNQTFLTNCYPHGQAGAGALNPSLSLLIEFLILMLLNIRFQQEVSRFPRTNLD